MTHRSDSTGLKWSTTNEWLNRRSLWSQPRIWIGRSAVLMQLREGDTVVVVDLDERHAIKGWEKSPREAGALQFDATNDSGVQALMAEIMHRLLRSDLLAGATAA
ncbi:hypothetical protein QTI66_28480 [Variovorax sp. J22R133]|uniref:hypothetical protein n=1 Tax=Variovorax brevis TaxID=3053503 RepID=UPI00257878DE|nr:hypothetical protein [Variovorax sp. J22R133]MDM0116111.1 hypothetical protein [Variovorax sp. J22R133]